MDYNRNPGESEEEFICRVCALKDKIGTWKGVADILNEKLGHDYTESAYRKKYQSFSNMMSKCYPNQNMDTKLVADIEQTRATLRKERIKLQTLNLERSRLDRAEARQELYYEYIGSVVEALPMPELQPIYDDGYTNMDYVLAIADCHYGAKFKTPYNEYSPTIFKQRLGKLMGKIIDFIKSKNLKSLLVVGLGDDIQGILRMTDLQINDSSVVKSVVEYSRYMTEFLVELSKYCYVYYYHCPTANHSQIRALNAKANELATEDLEYIIGNYIKDLCRGNDRITIALADENSEIIKVDVHSFNVVACHGHRLKTTETALRDLSDMSGQMVDYVIMGHQHGSKELTANIRKGYNAEILVAPSFIGSDPYSESLYKGSHGACKVFGFDREDGHTETYNWILD